MLENEKMRFHTNWIKKPVGFLRLTALVLLFVLFCLFFNNNTNEAQIVFVTGGFFISLFCTCGYIFDGNNPGDRPISELIFLIGFAIYGIIEGIILVEGTHGARQIPSGCLAILVGGLFAIDGFNTYKNVFGSRGGGVVVEG